MNLRYEELLPLEREDAERLLASSDPSGISNALIRVALHYPDWEWVQTKCILLADHPDVNVRRTSALCLGHIARIHRELDLNKVLPVLNMLLKDSDVEGVVQDVLDDIDLFITNNSS